MAEKLAIYKDLPTIVNIIHKNLVTWVVVETGSGKSIGIPHSLIRQGARVWCTQPTIPAATSLFDYQKKLSPKFKIGFAAEGDKSYDKNTSCIYCTAGHARKIMKSYFKNGKASDMRFTDIFLIDEIHTGSKDNSIILDLWLEAKNQGVHVPRLVLSTATDHGLDILKQRLGGMIFRSNFRHHQVEVRYQMRDYVDIDTDSAFADAARVAVDLLVEKKGHGIVFCSGSAEVEEVIYEINSLLDSRRVHKMFDREIKVLPCYGQCKREEIEEAICNEEEQEFPCIKIVVATNLAESSLTIPGAIFIVDMLSEKRSDTVGGRFHLGTTWISKNSADQRKGRTGRTLNGGVCHRMCTVDTYKKLEDFRPLEITRTPISDVVIECLTCGLDPVRVINDLEIEKLEEAKKTLLETGCIIIDGVKDFKELEEKQRKQKDFEEEFPSLSKAVEPKKKESPRSESFSAKVTDVGFFVADMPMDTRNAAAMYHYLAESEEDNDFWAIATFIIADLFGPNPFFYIRKERNEHSKHYRMRLGEHTLRYFQKFISSNPLESLVFAFHDCLDHHPALGLNASFVKVKDWAVENSCNNKKFREIIMQTKRIQRIFETIKIKKKRDIKPERIICRYDPNQGRDVIQRMMPRIVRSFYNMYKSKTLSAFGYNYCSEDGKIVSLDTSKVVTYTSPGSKTIPLSEMHIKTQDSDRIIVSLWLSVDLYVWEDQRSIHCEDSVSEESSSKSEYY
jgi:HrpA-like RNA helicase